MYYPNGFSHCSGLHHLVNSLSRSGIFCETLLGIDLALWFTSLEPATEWFKSVSALPAQTPLARPLPEVLSANNRQLSLLSRLVLHG
jgi:hypothetical protein